MTAMPRRRLSGTAAAIVAAIVAVLVLQSCSGGVVYDRYNHTRLSGWDKADSLFYDIPPVPADGRYRQEVGLRVNDEFPFTGLTLVVDQTVEPGHRLQSDTLNCKIADSKGRALGHGVSCYQYSFIASELSLNKGDSLHVSIRHIMKREILPGIADVGLCLSRIE